MEPVKDLGYVKLIWDSECKALISQWVGGFTGRDIRAGLDAGLQEYIKKGAGAQWIGDTTDIGVITPEEQDWINTNWFPRFLATGVKLMAVVQPMSAIAKMSVNSIVSKVPGTALTIYNCSSLEEARKWMKANNSK